MQTRKISTVLIVAYAVSIATLLCLAVLTVLGLQAARGEIEVADQSLRQLETARGIEAALNGYFLDFARADYANQPADAAHDAAAQLRGSLIVHRSIIGEEMAAARTEAERDAERTDMVRAMRLATVFEDIERKTMFARAQQAGAGQTWTARDLAQFLQEDERGFRQILTRIIIDERAEANDALARLEILRRRYFAVAGALIVTYLLVAMALGSTTYRRVLRPIQSLTRTVEGFPSTVKSRAPDHLPGEFALLANRFNRMLDRIEGDQERLQAEVEARTADLATANAELRRIDQVRRSFFANISHELRTPITVLLGEAQIALRGTGEERAALGRISANGGFLRRRLDDLLALARSEDGSLTLARDPVDLRGAITDAVGAARAFAEANETELALHCDGALSLQGDASALRQAALALIDNAVKFSPPGGTVSVEVSATGFAVRDEGPGFGDSDPMELFDRYVQGGAGRSHGGTGLGLAIVKWIADHHRAQLTARNRAEGGAEVRLDWHI